MNFCRSHLYMFDIFTDFIIDKDIKTFPKYTHFLESQQAYLNHLRSQYVLAEGYEAPGIRLLRYILACADIPHLLTYTNNYDRYMDYVRYVKDSLSKIFGNVRTGRGYFQLFYAKTHYLTEEFPLLTSDVNILSSLPFESNNWKDWYHVRPVRLWWHDAEEYSVNTKMDMVLYRYMPPSYSVTLIDVVGLVFKYLMWFKYCRPGLIADNDLARTIPEQYFLHKHVAIYWMEDLTNIWLLQQLIHVLDTETFADCAQFRSTTLQDDNQTGYINTESRSAYEEVWKYLHALKNSSQSAETILSSPMFLHGQSFNSIIRNLLTHLDVPKLRQYEYFKWLRDIGYLKFFFKVWLLKKHNSHAKRLFLLAEKELIHVENRKPWNQSNNTLLISQIKSYVDEIRDLVYEGLEKS